MIVPKNQRIIQKSDLLAPDVYEKNRRHMRKELVEFKKDRRVPLGPYATFYFECYETMLAQVQEMLHIEKGGDEQLNDELTAYNPLIPNGKETAFNVYHSLALYFYSERFYAGISALDIFATPNDLDILSYYDGGYSNNIIGQYNFLAGYYYPIDQQMNWAIEPSLLLKKTKMSDMQYHFNTRAVSYTHLTLPTKA